MTMGARFRPAAAIRACLASAGAWLGAAGFPKFEGGIDEI